MAAASHAAIRGGVGVSELKAGPELDALIAEKVMGWKVKHFLTINIYEAYDEEENPVILGKEFSPSGNIGDAWQVVERLNWDVKVTKYYDLKPKYQVHIFTYDGVIMEFAETVPLAICKAALRAVKPND
jgi:hypothetical protein